MKKYLLILCLIPFQVLSMWDGSGAPLAEAFDLQGVVVRRTPITSAIELVQKVQNLKDADPNLLRVSAELPDFEGLGAGLYGQLYSFYSESQSDREHAFQRGIYGPLTSALKIASEISRDFPQALGNQMLLMSHSSLSYSAIRGVFESPTDTNCRK